jgi:hypothetical protein
MAEPTRAQKIAGRKANSVRTLVAMKAATFRLTGDKELLKMLNSVRNSVARAAMRTALSKAARVLAKEMKNSVPVAYKSTKVVFSSVMRRDKTTKMIEAKAGAGVGEGYKKRAKKTNGSQQKGVGITGKNVHWYVLGTKSRTVRRTQMYRGGKLVEVTNWPTGEMPAILGKVVKQGFAAGQSKASALIRDEIRAKLSQVKPNGN